MAVNRLQNVHLYRGTTDELIGGLFQSGSITNTNLFTFLENILLVGDAQVQVSIRFRSNDSLVPRDDNPLTVQDYKVFCSHGNVEMTKEQVATRVYSREGRSTRSVNFRNAVRRREQRCVLTGTVNNLAQVDKWYGFEAAHVFPREHQTLWDQCGFSRFVTRPGTHHPINSVQNGLLLSASLHQMFDSFFVSVNPDDGYKITDFAANNFGVDGNVLDPVCRDPQNPDHVADELLRWHFRQTVLANMRGAGEPTFEHDFPPGSDMLAEIRDGPRPAERMELELFSRLPSASGDGESVL